MKVSIFGELNTFELFVLCTLIPAVFVYLWSLITGDMKVGRSVLIKSTDFSNFPF